MERGIKQHFPGGLSLNEVDRSKGEGESKSGRIEVERVSQYDERVRVKENTKTESRKSSVETSTD